MEQYTNQQPIVIEPAKPEKTAKPVGLQTAALIFGIIGFVLAFPAYFGTIASNIGLGVAAEYQNMQGFATASGVILIADVVLAIFCLVGLILGIVGLIKSICRATRTVKGIVMSAIGLTLSESGLVLSIIGLIIGGAFRLLIGSGVLH